MILKYGAYAHAANEAELVVTKTAVWSAAEQRQAVRERWTIQGQLHGASPAALTTSIDALLNAYSTDGLDAGLYLDDGVTPTSHIMRSSQSLGGVRVLGIDFPDSRGAEYATYRSYRIVLEAEFPNAFVALLSWIETVSFEGGGPRWVLIETRTGPPQQQLVSQATPYRVIQGGRRWGSGRIRRRRRPCGRPPSTATAAASASGCRAAAATSTPSSRSPGATSSNRRRRWPADRHGGRCDTQPGD
jgi:hypothetical protein